MPKEADILLITQYELRHESVQLPVITDYLR